MRFSDLFVPRWQNSNPEIRKRAITRLEDPKLLKQISEKDEDAGVRQAASERFVTLQPDA